MKIKRFIALFLALCLIVPAACAEEKKDTLDSALEWAGQAADDASKWVDGAWKDASGWIGGAWDDATKWISGAWGDASDWVGQAWKDSSKWLSDIWGDASSWAADKAQSTSDTVSAWWTETFQNVTKTGGEAWDWIRNESEEVREQIAEKYHVIAEATGKGLADAGEKIESAYTDVLKSMNLNDLDAEKILNTIRKFAAENGLTLTNLYKFLFPYLVKLAIECIKHGPSAIPAVAVAQFLLAVAGKENVKTEDLVVKLVNSLSVILKK